MIGREKSNSIATTLAVVIIGEELESSRVRSLLQNMETVVSRLDVISSDRGLIESHSEGESAVYHLVNKEIISKGSTSIRNSLSEALRVSPGSEHIALLNYDKSKLPSVKGMVRVVKSRLDYARLSNCILFSRKYARHVVESDNIPSAANAKKHGYIVPSLLSGLIHSPLETIEESALIKFAMVGASGVVVNELVLTIFKLWITSVNLVIGNAVAVELSIISNFVWNDMFTFKAHKELGSSPSKLARMLKYNLVSVVSTLVNLAVFYYLYQVLGIFYISSSLLAIGVAFGINYFGSSKWAWGRLAKDTGSPTL